MKKNTYKRWFQYKVLYALLDVETLMWNIAEWLIKPVAFFRRWVAGLIAKDGQDNLI